MEADRNPFPEIHIFPRLERVGRFMGRLFSFLPVEAPDYMSEHNRGAAPALDRALYDQQPEYESAGSYYFKLPVLPGESMHEYELRILESMRHDPDTTE